MKPKKYKIYLLFAVSLVFFILLLGAGITNKLNESIKYIYIDPGHGGFDGGATSYDNTIIEKDLTLEIAIKLKEKLEKFGYHILLTRYTDRSLGKTKRDDILKRVELLSNESTLLYISIHANIYPSKLIYGAQVFYKDTSENEKLSKKIQSFLKEIDYTNKRQAKPITGKYLIDNTLKIGCLIEVGFLSNSNDLKNLTDPAYQDNLVTMITLGIISYLGEK